MNSLATEISPPAFRSLLETLLLLSLSFLAILPLQQLLMVPFAGGALNIYEVACLGILFVSFLYSIFSISRKRARPFILMVAVAFFYTAFQLAGNGHTLFIILRQLRYFLPFIVATALLAVAPRRFYLKKTIYYLTVAALISAACSLLLHFFLQDTLFHIIRRSTDPATASQLIVLIQSGRSPWGNSSLVFICILALGYLNQYTRRQQAVIKLAVAVTIIGAVATLSRTMFIGLLLIALLTPLFYYRKQAQRIRYYLRMSFIAAILATGVLVLSATNARFGRSLALRFAINVGVSEVVDTAITGNRDILYAEYMKRLSNNILLGQGLGKPYAYLPERGPFYTVDNAYLSFMLPFGMLGFLVLAGFIIQIFRLIGPRQNDPELERFRRLMILVFGVTLLLSVNVDLISRNNYVIFLTGIALAFSNTRRLQNAP